eukprot:TRINITY_DN100524_c0_g1_i1.p1 TRINITY_DN100524_c0_g1~~TRINITY_DN100524_c0_g1_i1.p1  ORF type:complete len:241 (-),score=48.09 TRINITY_DN100524_c0_g1_i1:159-881(-)
MEQLREDPQGGKLYNRYERIRVEKVWRDTLHKEKDLQQSNPPPKTFQMNLVNKCASGSLLQLRHSHNRLELVADKVESQTPQQRGSRKGIDPNSYEVNMMHHVEKMPPQKWDLPVTRSQEVGWLISAPVRARTIRDMGRFREYPSLEKSYELEKSVQAAAAADDSPNYKRGRQTRSASSLPAWPQIPTGPPYEQIALMNKRPTKWYKPKTFCEITKYADNYVHTMHANPFAQVRGDKKDE